VAVLILIAISVGGVYFGYRLFCTGYAGLARRVSGALLAGVSAVVLMACGQHLREQVSGARRHTSGSPTLRFLRQERRDSVRPGHGKVGVEQFV
jgi:uncharacterized membrane protein